MPGNHLQEMLANRSFFFVYSFLAMRYVMVAGLAFLFFYILFRRRFTSYKIQKLFPARKDYMREIGFSFSTVLIFTVISLILFNPHVSHYTRVYKDIQAHSSWYFVLSIILALGIHDIYFYWTHRLMHHPRLFKLFHLTHHRSVNPSPWAAYAFNPLEAVVEGGVIFVIAFLIPIHKLAIVLFLLIMIIYNVYGHLGYEIYPRWVVKSRLGKWLNTSTNHNMHHKYFKGNYGLYTRFWDEWLHTTRPDYDSTLEQLLDKRAEKIKITH